jgi:hypothetical protein
MMPERELKIVRNSRSREATEIVREKQPLDTAYSSLSLVFLDRLYQRRHENEKAKKRKNTA